MKHQLIASDEQVYECSCGSWGRDNFGERRTHSEIRAEHRAHALACYREDVKAGRREPPKRNGAITRKVDVELDGSFGPDRGKKIVLTILPNGILELRPEKTRRAEQVHMLDVYRYAVRCRVNRGQLEKARAKKDARATRLAAQRQQRAEKRLVERRVEQ